MKARMIHHNGSPAMEVNGRVIPPAAFTAFAHTRDREYLRALGKAGIEVFFLICDPEWLYEGAFNMLMDDAKVLIEEVPNAKIFLRMGVHPSVEWLTKHPDEIMRYQNGRTIPAQVSTESYKNGFYPGMYGLYSQAWREEATKHIIDFLKQVEASPYSEHIIGAFLAGGNTSEWYPANKMTIHKGEAAGYYIMGDMKAEQDMYADFSPAFRKAFSMYLYDRYGSQGALRKAWNDPEADIDNPHIPNMNEREFIEVDRQNNRFLEKGIWKGNQPDNHVGSFLNADKYQCTADFYRAFHQGTADSVIHFAKAIKEYNSDLLVGAFYGYFGCLDYFNMGMCAGALKMLDCGYVDLTACPNQYIDRHPGGYGAQRVLQDSFRLRNRMFLSEDDTRTHLDPLFEQDCRGGFTLEDSVTTMKRDFGRNICQDIYGWWFDQVRTGRYKDETLYKLMERQQEIAKASYSKDRTKHNDVAFFYDEESVHYLSLPTLFHMIELNRNMEIPRMGMPADFYYHNDIARDDLPEYKLYVFVNCFYLSNEERSAIERKVKQAGKTALFIYGQGFINPDAERKLSVDHISELVGMKIRQYDEPCKLKFKIDPNKALNTDCDPGVVYGQIERRVYDILELYLPDQNVLSYPLFVCEDERAETLATICSNGLPAVSVVRENGFTSVFTASKWLTADFYRAIGRMAGCHIYQEQGDYVFANEHFVTIHAATTGEKTIYLKRSCSPYEVYENQYYGENVDKIVFKMIRGETKMFCLDGKI